MTTAEPRSRPHSPSGMEPRLRERRVAVLREQGRRRLRVLLAVIATLSVIGIGWLVVQSPLLAVDRVRVEGASPREASEVLRAAEVHDGEALLFVDTGAVARRVERLPWVADAHVTRDLPTTLRIRVSARRPVAWAVVPASGTRAAAVAIVDASGRVVRTQALPEPGLPELRGLQAIGRAGSTVHPAAPAQIPPALPARLRTLVRAITVRDGGTVLVLAATPSGAVVPAGEVRLGPTEDVHAKGEAALAVLDRLGAQRVAYIDVTVPSAPAAG